MPEVAINYRVVQSKLIPGFAFKFLVQLRFEASKMSGMLKESLSSDATTGKIHIVM